MHLPLGLDEALPIRTARLVLTRLDRSHLPALAAMLADPVVMRYFPRPMTLPETTLWLRRTQERYSRHGTGLWAVLLATRTPPVFIGDCGLQIRILSGRPSLELGYHFVRDAWGRGYATEAARACLARAREEPGVDEVIALIRPENGPSQRVARRLGLRPRGSVLHAGYPHDVWRIRAPGAGDAG